MIRFAAFGIMALVWGFTWLPMKMASTEVPPIFLAAMRFIVAGLCFLAIALVMRLALRPLRPARLALSTLLITTTCYAFVFWGVAHAPSGLSAIVNLSLIPVFSMLIGAALGEETITWRRVAALALGIGGLVALFATRIGSGSGEAGVGWGIASVVIGTVGYAAGGVVSRPLTREMPPISVAFWQTFAGGLTLLPISWLVEGFDPANLQRLLHGRALFGISYLVLGGSLVAFSIYLWLVRDWGPFRAGLYAFISPIIAVAVGTLYAGEPFGWAEACGMAVMLGATALVIRQPKPAAAANRALAATARTGTA